jgi:hypothetical protein
MLIRCQASRETYSAAQDEVAIYEDASFTENDLAISGSAFFGNIFLRLTGR